MQERQESIGEGEIAEVVGVEFHLGDAEIHGLGFGEVEAALDAGVQEHAVEIGVRLGNADFSRQRLPHHGKDRDVYSLGDKVGEFVQLGDVKGDGAGFVFAVLVDELLEFVLSPPDDDDIASFLDEARSHRSSYAASCADKQDLFVLERHGDEMKDCLGKSRPDCRKDESADCRLCE